MSTKLIGSFAEVGSSTAVSLFRGFNVLIQGGSATIVLERSFDGGSTWETIGTWTDETISQSFHEPEKGVKYRLRCSEYTSGTVTYRIGNAGRGSFPVAAARPAATENFIVATGGTITEDGDYRIHSFTTSGTFEITQVADDAANNNISVLLVGGGGAGGRGGILRAAGGGGAGGVIETTKLVSISSYPIVIGAGAASYQIDQGGNTTAFSEIALGGGSGSDGNGNDGASGAGAAEWSTNQSWNPGVGTVGQGNDGGYPLFSSSTNFRGGSGGGAASAANNANSGGAGISTSIRGMTEYFGGGGGGARYGTSINIPGGIGGGGAGGAIHDGSGSQESGTPGSPNTGGGGGGGIIDLGGTDTTGGSGGSGIVIVRYKFQ